MTTQERLRELISEQFDSAVWVAGEAVNKFDDVRQQFFDEAKDKVLDQAEQAILQLIETELLQKKVNIFTQFKVAMTAQDLSTRPTPPARFRTPLEELSLILENEIPLQQRTTLRGGKK